MSGWTRRSALRLAGAAFAAMARRPAQAHNGHAHHRVEIRGLKFVPDVLTVRPEDTVTFVNRDIAPHTATASDQSWDTGTLARDAEATITVTAGMTQAYFCRFHPMMKGELQPG
ncbi:cupredoxin domain-containing protein [Nitratireductor pacificus]|uniref:Copper-binding protein, plastocyanin/azurin family n=1 Tax=Nitratireductor pacificus pht-3B TaxID=391937 RepID=K2M768_9HYPH|nr:copper-binding protein, plastocyanin/azurin family [Nitratireductor pacificus]EKF18021.1 copper-binding protein, plastocyanin/azurin family [Nitratireductor pacificus pht-3B]